MKRAHKRTLLMVLLLLAYAAGGAIINVAVAWGCAMWVSAIDHGESVEGSIIDPKMNAEWHWNVWHREAWGACRISVTPNSRTSPSVSDGQALLPSWDGMHAWMNQRLIEANAEAEDMGLPFGLPGILAADARGWPLYSMKCRWDYGTMLTVTPREDRVAGGIRLSQFDGLGDSGYMVYDRALPLRPIWPGFAINTIFYAAILWLLCATPRIPGFVRRGIRARRGQCPACAYPIGSSDVCTECGRPLR
jgi:hypothetical protein